MLRGRRRAPMRMIVIVKVDARPRFRLSVRTGGSPANAGLGKSMVPPYTPGSVFSHTQAHTSPPNSINARSWRGAVTSTIVGGGGIECGGGDH
jgi:hypothetical protein